jgi:hypothetical protein
MTWHYGVGGMVLANLLWLAYWLGGLVAVGDVTVAVAAGVLVWSGWVVWRENKEDARDLLTRSWHWRQARRNGRR